MTSVTVGVHFDPDEVKANLKDPYTLDIRTDGYAAPFRLALFVGTVKHADALIKAAQELRSELAEKCPGDPDCSACFGTGLVHAGKSRPEVCGLCFPDGEAGNE